MVIFMCVIMITIESRYYELYIIMFSIVIFFMAFQSSDRAFPARLHLGGLGMGYLLMQLKLKEEATAYGHSYSGPGMVLV